MKRMKILALLCAVLAGAAVPASARKASSGIWVEAEAFAAKGGWVVDQQFMDEMGSAYLLAHGMGVPVADAVTQVAVPAAGSWHVYVRTYNWTAPWSDKRGPGAFRIAVGGKTLEPELGVTGSRWEWQEAGSVQLPKGMTELRLQDLTGFDGRIDAVFLSRKAVVPPAEGEALTAFRRRMLALPDDPAEIRSYDFVVIGGGIAGMCAAVAAARQGLRVALVNDRPVLGGNNSAEVRVHLGGQIELGRYPALGRMQREFAHSTFGNARPAESYEDEKKQAFISGEPLVELYAPWRAVSVRMAAGPGERRIASVVIRQIESSREISLSAPLFADCTGDGSLGVMAGADSRYGRESREEYGESLAQEKADSTVLGASVQWYSEERPGTFPAFDYGLPFSDESVQRVTMGEWTWETGMQRDMTREFERIRDYGLLVIYSNWSYLKNRLGLYPERSLGWVAYVSGKRESRRLLGDYVFKQDDIDKNVFHEDGTFSVSWTIDLHFPDPANEKYFPEDPFKAKTRHTPVYPAAVPYRCLYSRNVGNLFMAGRDISVTHVALGSTRVMRTCGMSGEVVGLAAGVCHAHGVTPREVYRNHLSELQALMEKGAAVEGPLPDNQHFNTSSVLAAPRLLKEVR